MNPYRNIVRGLRLLMAALVVLTLLAVAVPFFTYHMKPSTQARVALFKGAEETQEGVNWILRNQKVNASADSSADLVVISTAENFEDTVRKNINHNTVVFEMVSSKMEKDSANAQLLNQLTGVRFSGFVGKTFRELGSTEEVPKNLIRSYEERYRKKWTFSGEGLVLFSTDDVLVLQKGQDYAGRLTLKEGSVQIPYAGYFEVITVPDKPQAALDLKTTAAGARRLSDYGLTGSFPALVQIQSPLCDVYYYSVGVGNQPVDVPASYDSMPLLMAHKGIYNRMIDEKAYWQWYVPRLTSLIHTKHTFEWASSISSRAQSFVADNARIYRTDSSGKKSPFFIKGINLGAALPGTVFTDFPRDKAVYLKWFEQMHSLNVNAVRIYALFPPEFYEALHDYNAGRDKPLYLLQEIWPEEHPVNADYLGNAYNETYQNEIAWTVSAIHGDVNIPKRDYRAYGFYHTDISEYVLGYLVGREMEPQEVAATDRLNPGYAFKGEYFYSEPEASPTEAWLAASCDYVLQWEHEKYNDRHLVAIVSWPTLDSLEHDSEWNATGDKTLQYNDSAVVDIGHIGIDKNRVAGFFGAYHIYPNYPDFMNLDSDYEAYNDSYGRLRYGGYLKAFMDQHTRYPAVVAEYGISTSMKSAHANPDGLHHGGLSEQEQAQGIIRMTDAILREKYSGAVVFEWMDEWAKKTWITEPFMIPYDRHVLWHNVLDPEQNYGLLAYRESLPVYGPEKNSNGLFKSFKSIRVGQNEAYLFIDMVLNDGGDMSKPFELAIGTDSERGTQDYWEFLLKMNGSPELLVNPGYNWTKGKYQAANAGFEAFERLEQLINKENTTKSGIKTSSVLHNLSRFQIGSFQIPQNHIQVDGNHIVMRIPYGLLGISDPSSQRILSDGRQFITTDQDAIETVKNDTLRFQLWANGENLLFTEKMTPWEMPSYQPELKSGAKLLGDYFKTLP